MSDKILTFKQYQEIGREILMAMEAHLVEGQGISYDSTWVNRHLQDFTNHINHKIIRKYAGEPE